MMHRMKEPDAIRTCHNAVSASDAPLPVYEHNAVLCLICSADRADLNTGRVLALIAELWDKESLFMSSFNILKVP